MRVQKGRCWVWANHVIYHSSCPLCNEQITDFTKGLLTKKVTKLTRDEREFLKNMGLSHIATQLIRHPTQPLDPSVESERRELYEVFFCK